MNYEVLCAYLESKTGARRDMPFGIDTLVFKVLDKMFALMAWQDEPLRLSLKADPVNAVILCKQFSAVKPGYHLNKKHWITVTLDGTVPDHELRLMIDESYQLVVKGMPRKDQLMLQEIRDKDNGKETR